MQGKSNFILLSLGSHMQVNTLLIYYTWEYDYWIEKKKNKNLLQAKTSHRGNTWDNTCRRINILKAVLENIERQVITNC